MDPPHGLPRKRKQDSDDVPDVVEHTASEDAQHGVPSIPRYSRSKKPRLHHHVRPARLMKRGRVPVRPPPIDRLGSDVEDIGIVSNSAPGPLTGSLLDLRRRSTPIISIDSSAALDLPVPIDVMMGYIPARVPNVSRHALKELDLEVILRNPQLRHDLMFDYGLQFRPTCNSRKRQLSDAYWNAIIRELESGCTCFSLDKQGKPLASPACVCKQITEPVSNPIVGYSSSLEVMTVRMPSRIRPLLSEFLEVLLLVIQPLQSVSGMYVNPDSLKTQMVEHSTQANYIRFHFDPALIEQELKHDVFDLSSLFSYIGTTLKKHCAPMRDDAVEAMVRAAEACKPGGCGTKADAVNAVRACMDILELMKLDIANHQLQSLRVSISRTSAVYELHNFKAKPGSTHCQLTRKWLQSSRSALLCRGSFIPHPLYSPDNIDFRSLARNRQVYLSTLKGMTDLVFHPPLATIPETAVGTTLGPFSDYPETVYLDQTRLRLLSKDLGDLVVSYMLLLLFRQLLFSSKWQDTPSPVAARPPLARVDDADLLKLKNEIRIINSSSRLGHMLSNAPEQVAVDGCKWATVKDNIILHIAQRAQELRKGMRHPFADMTTSPVATRPLTPVSEDGSSSSFSSSSSPSPHSSPIASSSSHTFCSPPDARIVNVARRWAAENIHRSSSLYSVIYDRLHEAIFTGVVAQAYPGRQYTTGQLFSSAIESYPPLRQGGQSHTVPLLSGMESVADEIRTLTDRIARVAIIHLNVYLPIYERDGFLEI